MELYGEIKSACILIILAMHDGQRACFYPTALSWRKNPHCLLGREREGSRDSPHIREKEETLPVLELKNKFLYCA